MYDILNFLLWQDEESHQHDITTNRQGSSTYEELGEINHRYAALQRPDGENLQPVTTNLNAAEDVEFRPLAITTNRHANSTYEQLGEIDHQYTALQRPDDEYLQPVTTNSNAAERDRQNRVRCSRWCFPKIKT